MPVAPTPPSTRWLGVDFGTCYSSAARVAEGRPTPVKEPMRHGYSVPSSVLVTSGGSSRERVVGMAAESQKLFYPDSYVTEFKRELGRKDPVPLGDERVAIDDLVTDVLAFLRSEAERAAGSEIDSAVVTVPASYTPHLREKMHAAARKAGFDEVELLEEPVAALVEHARRTDGAPQTGLVLVYDLGGGTFDAAVVSVVDGEYDVLAYDGVPDVGGSNFDLAIERELVAAADEVIRESVEGLSDPEHPNHTQALRAKLTVREECRRIKHDLSGVQQAATSFLLPGGPVRYELTRDRLRALIEPDLQRTLHCCERVLAQAGTDWDALSGVLMVGGSCRLPFIGEAVAAASKRPIRSVDDPELAVCAGAAAHAVAITTPVVRDVVVDASGAGEHTTIAAGVEAAAPGARVLIRPGEYEERVVLDKPVELRGEGYRKNIVIAGAEGPLVSCAAEGIALRGLTLRAGAGPALDATSGELRMEDCEVRVASGYGVRACGDVEVTLAGNRIAGPPADDGWSTAFVAHAGAHGTLEHNDVTGMRGPGIRVLDAGTAFTCRDNRVHDLTGDGVEVADGAACVIEANDFYRVAAGAVLASGEGTRAELRGNTVRECGNGVVTQPGAALVAEDNEIHETTGAGVGIAGPARATLERNTVIGARGHGVHAVAADLTLTRNEVRGSAACGLLLEAVARAEIEGNEIGGSGGNGLEVQGGGRVALRDNVLDANREAGVLAAGGATLSLAGGATRRNRLSGVEVLGSGSSAALADVEIAENGAQGVLVRGQGSAELGRCSVYRNPVGVAIQGAGARAAVTVSRLDSNSTAGVSIDGPCEVRLTESVLENNGVGVVLAGAPGAALRVEANYFRANGLGHLRGPVFEAMLGGNDMGIGELALPAVSEVGRALESGSIAKADQLSWQAIRAAAGTDLIISSDVVARIPPDLLQGLDAVWKTALSEPLRNRPWVRAPLGASPQSATAAAVLARRLQQAGV